ncbi:MAG: DUF4340 domain-containing protein [Bdellovibrionales bacterium]|nr:DUF4340 domain-containing protein [Bdellovibrionales bacterium]
MSRKNPLQSAFVFSGVAVAIAALTYFVIRPQHEASENAKTKSSLLFGNLERDKVTDFALQNPTGTFHLMRKAENNEHWFVTGEKTFEADKLAVDGIVSTILAAKKENSVKNTDLTALGLNPPKFKLSMNSESSDKKAPVRELYLGEDTPVDYFVYAKWSDSNEVFLTSRSLRFGLDKKMAELRNKKVFSVHAGELSHIELKTPIIDKNPALDLKFERNPDGSWKSLAPATATLDKGEVERFVDSLANLNVTDFTSEVHEDRAKLGFGKPIATLTLKSSDPKSTAQTWVLAAAKDPKAAPKAPNGGMKYYFARLDQESTYEVPETFRDNFKTNFFRFRNKQVTTFKKGDVTGFTVDDGTTQLAFTKEGAAWKLKAKTPKGEKEGVAKNEAVDKALGAVAELRALEYFDGQTPATLGLRKPLRVVEVRGQKDGKETTLSTLFFGKKLFDDRVVVRAESIDAAAAVSVKVDEALPMKVESFVDNAAPAAPAAPSAPPSATSAAPKEGPKKVKLEATVKSLKELAKLPAPFVKKGKKYTAVIEMANGGKINIEFDADKAPYTVSNFLHLIRNGFYDNVKFHRVIPNFVAQGGDPTGTGTGGPGWKFDNEDNDLKHVRGALSMAHAGRNTNGSQFFIVYAPQPHLDGVHTVFAHVTSGMDVVDAIKPGDTMKKVEAFEE